MREGQTDIGQRRIKRKPKLSGRTEQMKKNKVKRQRRTQKLRHVQRVNDDYRERIRSEEERLYVLGRFKGECKI